MENETDTSNGGESLTLDQAAAAYTKATEPAVETDHAEADAEAQSDDTTDEELQAEESAGEDDDGEPGEADETSDEDEDDKGDDYDGGRFAADNARIKLPDGSIVSVSEAKSGYLKNADATKKWQDASELRKSADARSAAVEASEKQLEQMRDYNISLIKSIIPPEPDPTKANPASPNYDPAGYQAEQVAYGEWAKHLAYLEGQQTQAQQERTKKAAETEKETADKEWATLVEKLPHLKDGKRVDSFVGDLKKYATETYGFKPDEMKAIALDHRLALALNDAIKWNKLQASKATVQKKVEGRPPVQKGGKRLNPSEHRARASTDAMSRLNQSGRLDDAVAAYLANQK